LDEKGIFFAFHLGETKQNLGHGAGWIKIGSNAFQIKRCPQRSPHVIAPTLSAFEAPTKSKYKNMILGQNLTN